MLDNHEPKTEYTVLEYFIEAQIKSPIILTPDELLIYLDVLNVAQIFRNNIETTLRVLRDEYKKCTDISECIRIRVRNFQDGLIIIEIETTLPIISNKPLESRLFRERGDCRVANTSGPYNSDIFEQ